jgi:hypothetical protein
MTVERSRVNIGRGPFVFGIMRWIIVLWVSSLALLFGCGELLTAAPYVTSENDAGIAAEIMSASPDGALLDGSVGATDAGDGLLPWDAKAGNSGLFCRCGDVACTGRGSPETCDIGIVFICASSASALSPRCVEVEPFDAAHAYCCH